MTIDCHGCKTARRMRFMLNCSQGDSNSWLQKGRFLSQRHFKNIIHRVIPYTNSYVLTDRDRERNPRVWRQKVRSKDGKWQSYISLYVCCPIEAQNSVKSQIYPDVGKQVFFFCFGGSMTNVCFKLTLEHYILKVLLNGKKRLFCRTQSVTSVQK